MQQWNKGAEGGKSIADPFQAAGCDSCGGGGGAVGHHGSCPHLGHRVPAGRGHQVRLSYRVHIDFKLPFLSQWYNRDRSRHPNRPWVCRQLYIILSGACLLVGVTTTHGLGGKLWHARARGEAVTAWRFFQPFKCFFLLWHGVALVCKYLPCCIVLSSHESCLTAVIARLSNQIHFEVSYNF